MSAASPLRLVRAAALWVAAAFAQAQAQAPAPAAPPPAEAFFNRPDWTEPRLSPSGRYVAALAAGRGAATEGRTQGNVLIVVDLQGAGAAQAVARFSDVDLYGLHWVGDDHLVFRVSELDHGSGERRLAPGLFSVPRAGGSVRQLVKLDRELIGIASRFKDRRLESNHALLHVPRARPGAAPEVIVAELERDNRGVVLERRPKWLDVSTGATRRIDGDLPFDVQGWWFDADGLPRVAMSAKAGRTRLLWQPTPGAAWAQLYDAPTLELPWVPHSFDTAGTLYVTVARGAGGTRELARLDPATGRPQGPSLVSVPGFDFQGGAVRDAEGRHILGFRARTDAETTVWLDPALKALQQQIDELLPGRVNRLSCARCGGDEARDAGVVLVESHSDQDPGRILVWRSAEKKLTLLGAHRREIDPRRMAQMDFHRTTARDGRPLPVWVTRPQGLAPDAKSPAIVLVHGGPWADTGPWAWRAMPQFLASRGYTVVEPEFRGSTGFGHAHWRASWRQWGLAMQDDVADALAWAVKTQGVDPARVCIAGGSYGGYATLMGLVKHPELYRCGAAWMAVTDPMLLLQPSWWWSDDVSEEARGYSLPTLIGDPERDAERLKENAPVAQAARIKAPVLLAFGGLDRRVPLVHGRRMREALETAGNPAEWIEYPSEGHGFGREENHADFARRLEAFFGRHLRR